MGDYGGWLGIVILIGVLIVLLGWLISLLTTIFPAILGLLVVILIIISVDGLITGVFYAFKSFFTAVFEINSGRKTEIYTPIYTNGDLPRADDGSLMYYEDIAPESYFNGRMNTEVLALLRSTWKNIGKNALKYKDRISYADGASKKVIAFIKNIIPIISLALFGMAVSAVISLIVLVASLLIQLGYRAFYFAVLMIERLGFAMKKVTFRCDFCKEEYKLPVYFCPECGIPHKSLRPGKFGIFSRRCGCLYVLPTTARGKTADGQKRSEFGAACPFCGQTDTSGESRQLGIPLIGGVNAGKTTFKTAFIHQFLNDEATLKELKVDLPSKQTENEFEEIRNCFLGKRRVTETRPGKEYDVTSFNFMLSSGRLDVPRQLHIYDMPGEVFEQGNAQERLKHFTFSEGAIFVIDPYSLRAVNEPADAASAMRIGTMDLNDLVEIFLETLEKLPGMPKDGKRYSLPVAICINKVDTPQLRNRIGMPAAQKLMHERPDVYKDRYDTMDMLCREFLRLNGKANAITMLDQRFKSVHFFSCSSMGYVPRGVMTRFMPEHVLAAVYWIIARSDKQLGAMLGDDIPRDIEESARRRLDEYRSDYFDIIENSLIN